MSGPVLSVTAGTRLQQVARMLLDNDIGGVPVVDDQGSPIGVVAERNLMAEDGTGGREWWLIRLANGELLGPQFLAPLDRMDRTAGEIMIPTVLSVRETTPLPEIASLMLDNRIERIPVLREGRMVGIVSRMDLMRWMATNPAPSLANAGRGGGILSDAIAGLDAFFSKAQAPVAAVPAVEAPPPVPPTASGFNTLVEKFGQQKAQQRDQMESTALEQRRAQVKGLIDCHLEEGAWRNILNRARSAAEAGQKDLLLLRFPGELCSDGGRAINASQDNWPETLRGEAAEIYLRWAGELKSQGFHLVAQVIDFPGGMPGDIALTLIWGGDTAAAAALPAAG
jgi:CBS domain-containing protein